MVYPDIFIKTLIKQKLICGIVFEFKGEKDGQTVKSLQSRSAPSIKDCQQPRPSTASLLLDAHQGLPDPIEVPESDNSGTVVANWEQRAPLARCELLPCIYIQRMVRACFYMGSSAGIISARGNHQRKEHKYTLCPL